jgi:hypothetical protein
MKRSRAERLPPTVRRSIVGFIVAFPLLLLLSRAYFPAQVGNLNFLVTAGIGVFSIYVGLQAIRSGELRSSRYGTTMVVRRREAPVSFWVLFCALFLLAGMFLLFAASHLDVGGCCDPAVIKPAIPYVATAGVGTLCIYALVTIFSDLKTGDSGRGVLGRPPIRRDESPNRYWLSIGLRAAFVVVFMVLLISVYANASPG